MMDEISRIMATTSKINASREDKGKMISSCTANGFLSTTKPGNQRNSVVCSLTNRVPPIQAHMRFEDTDYFDQLLQLHTTYKISAYNELAGGANIILAVYERSAGSIPSEMPPHNAYTQE
nr:hypothetical protein [Tanacetum cinerariifolium]